MLIFSCHNQWYSRILFLFTKLVFIYCHIGPDSDNLHEDLAELTCSISIKQKLVEELEQAQKQVLAVRHQYEEKVRQLQMRIRATEEERDKVLSNINSVECETNEKVKKVKDEFEKKLSTLQRDLKKAEQAKRDYARMQKQSSYHEKQLKTLQHELQEMKKTKVCVVSRFCYEGLLKDLVSWGRRWTQYYKNIISVLRSWWVCDIWMDLVISSSKNLQKFRCTVTMKHIISFDCVNTGI